MTKSTKSRNHYNLIDLDLKFEIHVNLSITLGR